MTDEPIDQPLRPQPRSKPGVARRRPASFGRRLAGSDVFIRASAPILRAIVPLAIALGPARTEKAVLRLFLSLAPFLRHNRIAAANIALAFPEKSEAEHKRILRGAWENFAKAVTEFVFIDSLVAALSAPPDKSPIRLFGTDLFALRDDGKPAVIFSAHLANWELLAVLAEKWGLKMVLPYRRARNVQIAEDMQARRRATMGRLVSSHRGSALEIAAALDRGEHLGVLIDQRLNSGIAVPFFGRTALTNPLPAKLARRFDCPVHGARAVRFPNGELHLELTPALDLPRDAEGLIDVAGATARMTEVVEGWVREHPEQWFWFHDRWRT